MEKQGGVGAAETESVARWQELELHARPSEGPPEGGRAGMSRNRHRLQRRREPHGGGGGDCRRLWRGVTKAMADRALRASLDARPVYRHLEPRTIVLITDVGPDPYDVKALLLAATLHLQEQSVLAAVVCNGGGRSASGETEARNRAALARCILDYLGLHDIPVGIGEATEASKHTPAPYEYDFPGFGKVDDARLHDGQTLLLQTLELVEARSLSLVVISALSDVSKLCESHSQLLRDKLASVTVMGGVELHPDDEAVDTASSVQAVRTFPPPVFLRPDTAANNTFDQLRVVSREVVPNIPMRIVRAAASEHPYDPLVRYLRNASDLGLVMLWRKICRGELRNRDKRWFFRTFCSVSPAEFERLRADELGENFPIATLLDGVKSYDVVTLLLALHDPSDRGQGLFAFEDAKVELFGTAHYLFVTQRQLVPARLVTEHLQFVYQCITGMGKWSVPGRLQQTRVMLGAAVDAFRHQLMQGHAGWVMCGVPCIVGSRESLCSGSRDGTVRLWDVWTGGVGKVLRPEVLRLGGVGAAADVPAALAADAADGADAEEGANLRILGADSRRGLLGASGLLALRALRGRLRRRLRWPARPPPPPPPVWITSIAKSPSHPQAETITFFQGMDNGSVKVWSVARDGGSDTNDASGGSNDILQWDLKFSRG
ncbi:hypothetical protein T492DRAFT_885003 [Pavlovales sp. CCMP2436]|nr:hypothetical protein T492DRAFT_885003 [Pavlovales sp. CCMP2436]